MPKFNYDIEALKLREPHIFKTLDHTEFKNRLTIRENNYEINSPFDYMNIINDSHPKTV